MQNKFWKCCYFSLVIISNLHKSSIVTRRKKNQQHHHWSVSLKGVVECDCLCNFFYLQINLNCKSLINRKTMYAKCIQHITFASDERKNDELHHSILMILHQYKRKTHQTKHKIADSLVPYSYSCVSLVRKLTIERWSPPNEIFKCEQCMKKKSSECSKWQMRVIYVRICAVAVAAAASRVYCAIRVRVLYI